MNVRWAVVVEKDDETQPSGAVDGRHRKNNPSDGLFKEPTQQGQAADDATYPEDETALESVTDPSAPFGASGGCGLHRNLPGKKPMAPAEVEAADVSRRTAPGPAPCRITTTSLTPCCRFDRDCSGADDTARPRLVTRLGPRADGSGSATSRNRAAITAASAEPPRSPSSTWPFRRRCGVPAPRCRRDARRRRTCGSCGWRIRI